MSGSEQTRIPPFHGRRHGRKLRSGMAALLTDSLPRYRIAALQDGKAEPGQRFFDDAAKRRYLEIGFGGGEHLAARAEAEPDAAFIGAEPFINGVASLLRHIRDRQLGNIRIWPDDIRLLLPVLPAASLDGVYILFPDPWPKTRHRQRRIVQPPLLDQLGRLIRPGGFLLLASDDPTAKSWLLWQAFRHAAFDWQANSSDDWRNPPAAWPGTRYESKAATASRKPAWFLFRCKATTASG